MRKPARQHGRVWRPDPIIASAFWRSAFSHRHVIEALCSYFCGRAARISCLQLQSGSIFMGDCRFDVHRLFPGERGPGKRSGGRSRSLLPVLPFPIPWSSSYQFRHYLLTILRKLPTRRFSRGAITPRIVWLRSAPPSATSLVLMGWGAVWFFALLVQQGS